MNEPRKLRRQLNGQRHLGGGGSTPKNITLSSAKAHMLIIDKAEVWWVNSNKFIKKRTENNTESKQRKQQIK